MVKAGVFAALAGLAVAVAGCGTGGPAPSANSVITSTTKIAGAGVLGNQRRPDDSCAPEPARAEPGPRQAANTPGVQPENVEVPEDPQRIVVLSGDQLDALCALGLQSRIVAAALPDGSDAQPSYLGAVVHGLPPAGDRANPDVAAISAAHPDLILGAQPPQLYSELAKIAATVFTAAPGSGWEENLHAVGVATGRTGAADALVDGFTTKAAQVGAEHDATHYQASVVQLTENSLRVYGSDNFAASVLSVAGVDRPATQRFTDKPYVEIGTDDLAHANFGAADADIVFVSFASPAAKERAETVLDSAAWRRLSASLANRVFVVNNEVWQTGRGIVAARGILDDLKFLNAPIN